MKLFNVIYTVADANYRTCTLTVYAKNETEAEASARVFLQEEIGVRKNQLTVVSVFPAVC